MNAENVFIFPTLPRLDQTDRSMQAWLYDFDDTTVDRIKNCLDLEEAETVLQRETGMTLDDLPDGIPLDEFIDESGNLDYDGILNW